MTKCIKSLLLLALCIMIFPVLSHGEAAINHTEKAEILQSLEIFHGTSNGFELEKTATRAEAAAMLIRLLGEEKEAKENDYKHPFTDVPAWADPYIGYMYTKGLTTGIGNNKYASSNKVDGNTYATFVLRALGYDDNKGDFKWNNAIEYSKDIGLLSEKEAITLVKNEFKRDDLVLISYNALKCNLKNNTKTLVEKLITNSSIKPELGLKYDLLDKDKYEVLPYIIEEVNGEKIFSALYSEIKDHDILNSYFILDYIVNSDPFTTETKIKKIFMTDQFKKRTLDYIKNARDGELIVDINTNRIRDIMKIPFTNKDSVIGFYNDKLKPTHYVEVSKNLDVGAHYLPIIPVDEELTNLYLSREKRIMDFVKKYQDKIVKAPDEAISTHIINDKDGIRTEFVKINRELLPESMREFVYADVWGVASTTAKDGLIDMLRHMSEKSYEEFRIVWEPDEEGYIRVGHTGPSVIILLSENKEPLGYAFIIIVPGQLK